VYSSKSRPVMATTGMALFFYGCFRFLIEFFRMPDAQLGFMAMDWVTMGQILSTPMIIIGAALFYFSHKSVSNQ
jgi:phosphatidylglycerol---prolipoprotein diacylglyceryl transferase